MLLACPVYWALGRWKLAQDLFLLSISYFFYACWDVEFLALILGMTAVSFWVGEVLSTQDGPAEPRRKQVLIAYLVFAAALLGFFKYCNFFIDSALSLLNAVGVNANASHLNIVLPAAISFYTFESISHVVGAYTRSNRVRASWIEYALFIAFFPKLVAGPIERPNNLTPQLQAGKQITLEAFGAGLYLIVLGLFKKIAIADGLAPLVSSVFEGGGQPSAGNIAAATLAFTLQIYGDFSGYSDIARGVALWFGIRLSLNFNVPYVSLNPSEFWRRWHISLSTWLRDYIYIPLGGNREGEGKARRNQMITMLLGGLWHGAAWTFIAWGAYQGALLALHRAMRPALTWLRGDALAVARHRAYDVLAWATFFLLTCYGWLIFRASDFDQIMQMSQALVQGPWHKPTVPMPPLSVLVGVPLLLIIDVLHARHDSEDMHVRLPLPVRGLLYASLVFVILLGMANARSSFIYFQF